jgi:hypothetical protein
MLRARRVTVKIFLGDPAKFALEETTMNEKITKITLIALGISLVAATLGFLTVRAVPATSTKWVGVTIAPGLGVGTNVWLKVRKRLVSSRDAYKVPI